MPLVELLGSLSNLVLRSWSDKIPSLAAKQIFSLFPNKDELI